MHEGYELTYRVEPYPEKAEAEIAADEYRLLLIVSSTPKQLQTEADFTGWVTEIHSIGNKGTVFQVNSIHLKYDMIARIDVYSGLIVLQG